MKPDDRCVSLVSAGASGDNSAMNWIFWALLSAAFAGATAVLAKAGVAGLNSHLATAIRTTVVLLFTWGVAALFARPWSLLDIPRRAWVFLILSGVATALSWICYFRALQLGEASRVAPVDKLSVLFAILLAAWFLREKLTWQHGVGGALIVTGAIVIAWKPS
jgi:transporter family protein